MPLRTWWTCEKRSKSVLFTENIHVLNIQVLRNLLDQVNLPNIGIIAADGNWDISSAMLNDPYLNDAVEVIG